MDMENEELRKEYLDRIKTMLTPSPILIKTSSQLLRLNNGKTTATIVPSPLDKISLSQDDRSFKVFLTHKSIKVLITKLSIKTYSIYISIPILYEI